MANQDPDVFLDTSRVYEITERSDFDRDQKVKADDLGEDWGDGFFVEAEPVLVDRDAKGAIIRTTPLSQVPALAHLVTGDEAPPIEGRLKIEPKPLSRADRNKLVEVLALKLFNWYKRQPPNPSKYNPVHDGIPDVPPGSPEGLQPLPGSNLYPATPGQVIEWLKTTVIGPRVQVINKKQGWEGYRPSLQIKR